MVKLAVKNAKPKVIGLNPSTCSQHPKVRYKVTRKMWLQSFLKTDLNFVYLSGEFKEFNLVFFLPPNFFNDSTKIFSSQV